MQSDVPEVSELCWLLMTGTPMGLLERCHAYKDKKAKGLAADAGLFTYPVLQAADILAYDSDTVPVGEDQVQHIEVCRDLAGSFNHQFGERVRDAQGVRARNVGPRAGHRRREDVEELQQHARWCSKTPRRSASRSCGSSPTRGRWTSRRNRPATCSTICFRSWRREPQTRRDGRRSIAAAASATATSRRRWPTRPKSSGPSRGRGGPSWRRSRITFTKSSRDGAAKARKKAAAVLKRAQDACGIKGW